MIYLIAHKVRGEPALDVALKMEVNGADWWIIPTSGHRAYPYWFEELSPEVPEMPEDTPDHYQVKAKPKVNIEEVMALFGKPAEAKPIRRRV